MKEHGSFNRCYRLLWSGTTEQWKPVPETARTAKKGGRGKAANTLTLAGVLPGVAMSLFVMSNLAAQPPPAPPTAPATTQLPTGGNVVGGQATISQSAIATAANMVVNQSSQRAIIDWSSFNLGASATVQFVQPNAQSVILNRVLDPNPTQVFGRINANGQVFLTNPYGVYFAPSASVDVGGLVATTYSISNDDFMSGRYTFNRNGSTASVINQGNLSASLGGYIALLAPEVQNSGVVLARAGTVAFAAGEQVSLTMLDGKGLSGITTTASAIASLIDNKLAVQAPDGQIILSAVAVNKLQGGVIKNSGSLQATSLSNQGGKIVLEGDEIELASTASIDVSGRTRGGTVLMGGDWQGSGNLRQATTVRMAAGATINANATDSGDGGKVVLWSNVSDANSTTTVAGSIYASAGPNGGNGGQIETSGHYLNVDGIQVSTLAPKGTMGEWLLDPSDITISTGTAANYTNVSNVFTPNSSSATSVINNATLSTALGTTNITVTTVNSVTAGTGVGAINIAANLSWSSGSTLTLIANDSINGTGNISMTGGGSVVFNTGNATTGAAYSGVISGNGSVTKQGLGNLKLSGANTYTGNTTIEAGIVTAGVNTTGGASLTNAALGLGTIKVLSGATFAPNGFYIYNPIEIAGTGAAGATGALWNSVNTAYIYGNTTLTANNARISSDASSIGMNIYGDILSPAGNSYGFSTAGNRTINLMGSKSILGDISLGGTSLLYIQPNGSDATFANNFSVASGATFGIVPTVSNTVTVNGSVSGAGNASIGSTAALGAYVNGNFNLSGTTSIAASNNLTVNSTADYTWGGNISATGTLNLPGTGNLTLAGVVSGTGTVNMTGAGNLTLTGNSTTYNGFLKIGTGSTVTMGDGLTSGLLRAGTTNNGTLNFNRTDAVTYATAISGTGVLNKLGSNVLTLSAANTFTGNVYVQAGTLKATNASGFGSKANISISDVVGAGLEVGAASTNVGALSGGANATVNVSTFGLTVGTNNVSSTYAGTLVGSGALTKTGTGSFTLSGNSNTFTGNVASNGTGNLVFTNTTVIGNGTNEVQMLVTNSTLELQNVTNLSNPINLTATGVANVTLMASSGDSTLSGILKAPTNQNTKFNVSAGANLTLSGNMNTTASTNLYKLGDGTLKVTGNNTLVVSNWNVNKGVTVFGSNLAVGKTTKINTGNITLSPSATAPTDTGNGTVWINTDFTLANSLMLNASGGISGNANIALGSNSLTLNATQSSSLSGNISGTGTLILGDYLVSPSVMTPWLLSGANTFSNLSVYWVNLQLGSDSVVNSTTGAIVTSPLGLMNGTASGTGASFSSGSTLDINGHTLANSFIVETGGKLLNTQGTGLITGNLSATRSDFEINVSAGSSLTIAGGLPSTGMGPTALKTGTGTLIFQTPSNSASQSTTSLNITAGQVIVNSTTFALWNSATTIAANTTLEVDRWSSSWSFNITDNGLLKFNNPVALSPITVNITGTGSVRFSGTAPVNWGSSIASSYTGGTTIDPSAVLNIPSGMTGIGNVSIPIENNGNLVLITGSNGIFNQTISGSGNVTISAGTSASYSVSLPSNNTYTGTTTLGPNTTVYVGSYLNTSTSGSLGSGNITINDNANLVFARADNTTVYNNITSTTLGTLTKGQNSAKVDLAGNLNLTGGIKIYGGTLQIDTNATLGNTSSHTYNGAISIFNTSTFEFSSATDAVLNGNITQNATSYTATLVKDTSVSNLTLNGNNTYTNTVIEAGTLYVGSGGAGATTGKLGTGTVVDNVSLVFNHSGAYSLSTLVTNTSGITGTGNVTAISTDNNLTIDRNITLTGANSLIKLMAGTNLAANNATGNVTLSNNVSTTSTGTLIVYAGSPATVTTASLMNKTVGASGAVDYKTYNATLSNISSAVAGTRNFFYRVQPTATINGGTVTATKVYDGTTSANPNYTGGGSTTGIDGDTLTGCVTGASYNTSSAGNKSLTYNVALASNNSAWVVTGYAGTVNPTSTVANITQAPLAIQANDAADFVTLAASSGPFAGVSYSGFVHGENATTAGLTGTLNISRAAGNSAGTYLLTPSGQLANNYAISYRTGNYTIVPAQQLIIRVSDGTNVYGDASNLSVSSVTYLMPDNVTIANLTSSLTTSNGLYSINDGVGGTASFKLGLSNANLTASSHAAVGLWNVGYNNLTIGGTNFNSIIAVGTQSITKRDLTLTTVADNKVYDGNTNATFNISTNRITGDALTLSTDALGVFANRNAANGTVVTVGNITISGNDASNYNLLSNVSTTTANITPKTLTLSGLTANNKVYDATANATIATLGTVSGMLGLDDVQVGTSAVTGTFSDKNVGNGKTVTLAGFTMGGAQAGNYKIDSATTTANITPKALTVSGLSVAASKVYDGTTTAAPLGTANLQDAIAAGTGTSSDGKAYSGDSIGITGTPVGTYNSKDVATAANVSITGLTLTNNTLGNYVLTAPTPLAATITPKDLTIKVNDDAQFFTNTSNAVGFNGVSYKGFVTGESSANLTFSNSSAPGVPNISTSLNATQKSTTGVYAGALTLDGTVTNSNYNITVQTGNFTVVGADQLLVRVNNVNTTYGTAANLVVGSAQYVSNNTNVLLNLNVSSSGNQVTVDDGLGSGGGAVMTLSPTVLASQLSGSHNAKVGIYNIGGTVTCVTSGVNFNNTVVVVGTETVTAKALTATATAADKTYNSNASATVTVTSSDVITGDTVGYAYTSAEFLNKNAGTNKAVTVANISLSGTDAGNYVIQNLVASTTANITQKALTITGITAANKVYDGTTAAVVNVSAVNSTSLVGMGLVTGDNLTLSATGAFADKNAGDGKTVNLTSTYAGADVGNYLITSQVNTTANITQKTLTITGITASDKVYNGTNVAAVNVSALNSTSLVGMGMLANDTVTVSATGVFADKNVGTNKTVNLTSTYGGSDAGNYNIVSQVNTTANITAKDVTLAAPQATQVYNGSAIYTANATQLAALSTELGVVGDSVTGVTLTYNNPNAATGKTLTATSAVISDGNGGHNYNVSYTTNTTSVITAKDVTLAAPQATRAYDGTANYTANVTQLAALTSALGVAGDSVSNIILVYNDQNAATGKTLTASSAVISDGNSGHNYNVSYATNTTSVITAKDVTLVAPQVTRTYDGTVNYTASTTQLAALTSALGVAGDSVTSVLLAYNDKNVGTGRTLTASNAVVSDGNNGLNYNISYTNNTASVITAKDVTLAAPQASRAYDGTVNYTANATQLAALTAALGVAGDSVSNITLAYNSPNAATGKTLTASNAVVSDGNNGLNYNVSYTSNTTSVITPKDITIVGITAGNKTYDGNTTAVVNVSAVNSTSLVGMGMIAGDDLNVSATGVFDTKHVGTGKTVTLTSNYTGADVGNYNITSQVNTTANITAKALNITGITAADKVYDGNTVAVVNVSAVNSTSLVGMGLVSGDNVSVNATGVFADKEVGTHKTVTLSSVYGGSDAGNYNINSQASTWADITAATSSSSSNQNQTTRVDTMVVPKLIALSGVTTPIAAVSQPAPMAMPSLNLPDVATTVAMAAPISQAPTQATGSNAPPPPLASTASTSGVLPVSVLGDSRVSNLGMTYSEQPNDIRIQMTTSPDVPKLTATAVRFTGNFKTFIVNNDRGEMVPYQGAMIGKRIVILAETEASKNLARQEMQTVLAAAITTLGSTGSISLAQVEGVVLDLR